MAGPTLIWFRHDLRLADNPALTAAAATGRPAGARRRGTQLQRQPVPRALGDGARGGAAVRAVLLLRQRLARTRPAGVAAARAGSTAAAAAPGWRVAEPGRARAAPAATRLGGQVAQGVAPRRGASQGSARGLSRRTGFRAVPHRPPPAWYRRDLTAVAALTLRRDFAASGLARGAGDGRTDRAGPDAGVPAPARVARVRLPTALLLPTNARPAAAPRLRALPLARGRGSVPGLVPRPHRLSFDRRGHARAVAHRDDAQPGADADGVVPHPGPAAAVAKGSGVVLGYVVRRRPRQQRLGLAGGGRLRRRRRRRPPAGFQPRHPRPPLRRRRRLRPPLGAGARPPARRLPAPPLCRPARGARRAGVQLGEIYPCRWSTTTTPPASARSRAARRRCLSAARPEPWPAGPLPYPLP